jgi:hypothetical protein
MKNEKNEKHEKIKEIKTEKPKKAVRKRKEEAEKKTINPNIIVVVFIVGIVVIIGAIVGFRYFKKAPTEQEIIQKNLSSESFYSYNGYVFTKKENFWTTTVKVGLQPYDLILYYGPRDLEDIHIVYKLNNFSNLLTNYKRVLITFDPDSQGLQYIGVSGATLTKALVKVFDVNPVSACTKNVTACDKKPIISACNDTQYPLIIIKNQEPTSVVYEGNCLILQGKNNDLIRATDKALLGWYGVLK